MQNAIAVFCAAILPLASLPRSAFAANGEAKQAVFKGITYLEVKVPGSAKTFYCEAKECGDPARLAQLGRVPLYHDFDSEGDPTLSKFSLTFDKGSRKALVTKDVAVVKTDDAVPAGLPAKDSPKKAKKARPRISAAPIKITQAPDPGDYDPTPAKAATAGPLFDAIREKITDPANPLEHRIIEYLLRKQTDKPAAQKALLDGQLAGLRAQAAGIIASVAANPGTAANAHVLAFLKGKSLDGTKAGAQIDSRAFLDAFCARRGVPGVAPGKNPSAIKQLVAAKEGELGITSDGKAAASSQASALDGKCSERKKEKALAMAGEAGINLKGSDAPPAPGGATDSAEPGYLGGMGNFVGAMAGGAALAVVAAAIAGGPLGLAAVVGALAGGVAVELYAHRAAISDAVSKAGDSIGDFFKGR